MRKSVLIAFLVIIVAAAIAVIVALVVLWKKECRIEKTLEVKSSADSLKIPCSTFDDKSGICLGEKICKKNLNGTNAEKSIKYNAGFCGPKKDSEGSLVCCEIIPENLFPEDCGNQTVVVPRIIGGSEAGLGEYPWMARLIYQAKDSKKMSSVCSGFLVSWRFVLTAAHCLGRQTIEGDLVGVELGVHDIRGGAYCVPNTTRCAPEPIFMHVENYTKHPDFSIRENLQNDIALIRLEKGLEKVAEGSFMIQPICLLRYPRFQHEQFFVSGWGVTELGGVSTVKLHTSLNIYPHKKCMEQHKTAGLTVTEKQICAGGEENQDSCNGDSGGPLMADEDGRYFAAGIVSYGATECGKKGWPGIYTKISSYFDWIEKEMRAQLAAEDDSQKNEDKENSSWKNQVEPRLLGFVLLFLISIFCS